MEVLQAISKLESSQTYLTNKKKRIELSQLYSKVKGLSNPFPSTSSLSGGIPSTLNKDVSESCPACIKKVVMLKTIEESKADLENYARVLGGEVTQSMKDFDKIKEKEMQYKELSHEERYSEFGKKLNSEICDLQYKLKQTKEVEPQKSIHELRPNIEHE